jgi:PAS domain S-box-containing protein
LLTDFRHETDVEEVARRLLDAIEIPVALPAHEPSVTASIGIAFFAGDGENEADLLKRADEAMYAAKRGGKNAYAIAPRAEPSLPAPPGALRSDRPSIGPSERARTLSRTNEALRQEIASRAEAEAALRVSEEKFRRVTETLPMLVWTCASDGRCDYLGPQWVAYTGIPAAEQLGYGWVDQLHPEDRDHVQVAWNDATASGSDFDVDFRLRRADGCFRWFKARAVPLRDAFGNIVQWFGSNTDIDDLRQFDARVRELTRSLEAHVIE